jgi:hypothetical protein
VELGSREGRLELRGVPDGAYTLLLGAKDHLGELRRIVLRKGEHRRIQIVLPRRN